MGEVGGFTPLAYMRYMISIAVEIQALPGQLLAIPEGCTVLISAFGRACGFVHCAGI